VPPASAQDDGVIGDADHGARAARRVAPHDASRVDFDQLDRGLHAFEPVDHRAGRTFTGTDHGVGACSGGRAVPVIPACGASCGGWLRPIRPRISPSGHAVGAGA